MKTQRVVPSVFSILLMSAFVTIALAGGWATITLKDFPEYSVAGKPLNLVFIVRQHGQTPLGGLQPSVRAKSTSGLAATAAAKPAGGHGEYAAVLSLPQAGDWTITIASGFNDSATTLPNLKVIASG